MALRSVPLLLIAYLTLTFGMGESVVSASGSHKGWFRSQECKDGVKNHKSHINYTTVAGFFLQDDPTTNASTFDYVSVFCLFTATWTLVA